MAKEAVIRRKAVQKLEAEGYTVWVPAKVRYRETDILGVWDCIAIKPGEIRLVQYTSRSNISTRRKKITSLYERVGFSISSTEKVISEVWGYDRGDFKIEEV